MFKNRVLEIRNNVSSEKWFYCNTSENPSDIITREKFNDKLEQQWWSGSSFLMSSHVNYIAANEIAYSINEDSLELPQKHSALFTETMRHEEIINVHKYNDLLKLFRITAYVLRFVNNMKRKQGKKKLIINKYLSTEELVDAKRYWIKKNQEVLKNQKNFVDVEKVLNVKKHENGLLRSSRRMKKEGDTTLSIS